MAPPPNTRVFAWDGLSFRVPETWCFAAYSYQTKHVARVELEDDYTIRLEVEWIKPRRQVDRDRVQKKYSKKAERIGKQANRSRRLHRLPKGWGGNVFTMNDGIEVMSAYYLSPDGEICAWFRGHFSKKDPEKAESIIAMIAKDCEVHTKGMVPWNVYDVAFEVPATFRLMRTSFHAGRKELIFIWRLRKYRIWFFSLAEIILRDNELLDWAVEYLNADKYLKGPIFYVKDGEIRSRRTWRYPVGHKEEIGRMSYRYHVTCHHDAEANQIVLAVFQHRRKSDLLQLPRPALP